MYIWRMNEKIELINSHGVSIVIPCYNSERSLGKILREIKSTFADLNISKYEIILVTDSPRDNTLGVAIDEQKINNRIIVLELNKNFGQHAAIFAGLRETRFDFIVTMDDDGQHPVSEIDKLLNLLCGDFDVVYGVAAQEEHSFFRNFFSRTAKYFTFRILNVPNAKNVSSFRAFKRIAIEGVDFARLNNAVVDVVLHWNTSKFHTTKVDMLKRSVGRSNYSFYRLVRLAINMIIGYSIRPLRIATLAGLLTFFASTVLLIVITIRSIKGEILVAGYTSVSLFVLFLGAIQLLTLGLIGEYLGKVHENSMGKPQYIIKKISKVQD
jgi:glycosyltransferase involved in cell wall biosynthesis